MDSALVLAGILPLDIRIREAAALYNIKKGIAKPMLDDGEIETLTSYKDMPHPSLYVDMQFKSLVNQQELADNSKYNLRIFTDGSRIGDNVGASLSLWNNESEIQTLQLKLSSYCTVYQAELLAINRATREVVDSPEESFGVYSDSRAALETIINWKAKHPLAVDARINIKKSLDAGKRIDLYWVKAHVQIKENERADQLTKETALEKGIAPNYAKCPVSFVKRRIRNLSVDEWNQRYKSGSTAAVTKMFFPDVEKACQIMKSIKVEKVVTQMLTGHGGFSEYLNRFKCKEDPSCTCAEGVPESVAHVLFECPVFAFERYCLEQKLGCKIYSSIANEILSNKITRDKFLKYGRYVVNKVIARNKSNR